jgi:hypothetical protein
MKPIVRFPHIDRRVTLSSLAKLLNIAGGAKGDALKKRIEAGQYPGIVKTTLDGVDQTEYLSGRSEKSARDTFFYYSGKDPSAVRYKNWKIYFTMVSDNPAGFLSGALPYHWAQVVNIKRDPFETSIGSQYKTLFGMGGAISAPATAYVYDWNMLPIGQALAEGTGDLFYLPATAGPGELRSQSGLQSDQGGQNCRSQRLVANARSGRPEKTGHSPRASRSSTRRAR